MAEIILTETASVGTPGASTVTVYADNTANPQIKFVDDNANVVQVLDTRNTAAVSGKTFTLAAGTNAVDPLTFTSGTNLTAAAAGAFEYDGVCFYSTPVASARGVSPSTMYSIVPSTNWDIAETPAAQPAFPTTGDVWTLNPSTSYFFKGQYYITKTTTSVTVAMVFATAGGSSITSIGYKVLSVNAAANAAPAASNLCFVSQATSTVVTVATTTNTVIIFEGIIRMGSGAGTLTPQIAFSTTTTAAIMAANSYISFTPIGTDTNNILGNVG